MSDKKVYLKLNTSLSTCSNASTLERNQEGYAKANIELRLPENLTSTPCSSIDLQVSKLRLSLEALPITFIPVDPLAVQKAEGNFVSWIETKAMLGLWYHYINDSGAIASRGHIDFARTSWIIPLRIPKCAEPIDYDFAKKTGLLPIRRVETLELALQRLIADSFYRASIDGPAGSMYYGSIDFKPTVSLGPNSFTLGYTSWHYKKPPEGTRDWMITLLGVEGARLFSNYDFDGHGSTPPTSYVGVNGESSATTPYAANILANQPMKDLLNFLPWLKQLTRQQLIDANAFPSYLETSWPSPAITDEYFYVLDLESADVKYERCQAVYTKVGANDTVTRHYATTFTHTFPNVATVTISPISSIVVLMDGMGVTPEIMPINIKLPQSSSLTTTVPIIENYIPLTQSLDDLHDDLVVSRTTFDDTPLIKLHPSAIYARTLNMRAAFVTKDGQLFDIYVPPSGSFYIQLTFCLHQ